MLNEYQPKLIIKLRDETGHRLMDCKQYLEKNNWDYEKAKSELKNDQYHEMGRRGFIMDYFRS